MLRALATADAQRKAMFSSAWAVIVVVGMMVLLAPSETQALVVRCDTLGTTAYFTFLHSGARFGPQYVAPPGKGKDGKNSIFPWARNDDGEFSVVPTAGDDDTRVLLQAQKEGGDQLLPVRAAPSSASLPPTASSTNAEVGAKDATATESDPAPGTFSNVSGALVLPEGDSNAYSCQPFALPSGTGPAVVLAQRGNCFFIDKAVRAEAAGAKAVIVFDDEDAPLIIMSSQNSSEHVDIPAVFVSLNTGLELMALHGRCDSTSVVINGTGYLGGPGSNASLFANAVVLLFESFLMMWICLSLCFGAAWLKKCFDAGARRRAVLRLPTKRYTAVGATERSGNSSGSGDDGIASEESSSSFAAAAAAATATGAVTEEIIESDLDESKNAKDDDGGGDHGESDDSDSDSDGGTEAVAEATASTALLAASRKEERKRKRKMKMAIKVKRERESGKGGSYVSFAGEEEGGGSGPLLPLTNPGSCSSSSIADVGSNGLKLAASSSSFSSSSSSSSSASPTPSQR